jgi:hypothetical protein
VVSHHVAGARLVRSGPRSDEAVDRHRGLDLIRDEEPVEQIGDRQRHQPRHLADGSHVQTAEPPGETQQLEQIAGAFRADLRRRGHQQRTQDRGQSAHPRVPTLETVCVDLRDLRELLIVLLRVVVLDHHAAVRERNHVRADGKHAIPVARELEVLQDRVGHEAHHVAERRDFELGVLAPGPVGRRRAPGLVPTLAHDDAGSRLREIRGRHQTVVSTTDDDRLIRVRARARLLTHDSAIQPHL